MDSDDFIGLNTPCNDENVNGDSDLHVEPKLDGFECQNITSRPMEDASRAENREASAKTNGEGDDPDVQDMDLEDDSDLQVAPRGKEKLEKTGMVVETVETTKMVKVERTFEAGEQGNGTISNHITDESTISGVKRARTMYVDKQPSVRVVYDSLTRESKRKLMQLMQQWSEWEAKNQLSSQTSKEDALEDGEETYFPALFVGFKKSSSVSFWIDNQGRKETVKDCAEFDSVPLYDRGCKLSSASADGSSNNEGTEFLDDSRCFNCQSYGHSLKDCPMPRDNAAISNARKMHNSKRTQSSNNRDPVRYYKKTPGKFDDLQPGVLGTETRESLGIGEHDPPPWLHRMREMGYPPGYIEEVEDEDQPSGITIYAEEETEEEYEDGELPEKAEPVPSVKKMTVEFPGINAPIPANADQWLWGSPSTAYSSSSSHRRHFANIPSLSSEPLRIDRHGRASGPRHEEHHGPGHGLSSTSYPGYSSRYSPYDDHRPTRSPNLGRSLSDRGRSSVNYETSTHSPHSLYHPPVNHSPSYDRWNPNNLYNSSSSPSFQQGRDKHEHEHPRRHHRR